MSGGLPGPGASRFFGGRIEIVEADLTTLSVDAVVNAANESLLGGGGVDGALHLRAGPKLLAACRILGGARPGEAKITPGFDLPARFVIHAVGPVWSGGAQGEPELLARCYRRAVELAAEHGLGSIAFPAISTGAYRFPLEKATRIALSTVRDELSRHPAVARAVFCCFHPGDRAVYAALAQEILG